MARGYLHKTLAASRAILSSNRRASSRVTGPGRPAPIGVWSMRTTGRMPRETLVRKHSLTSGKTVRPPLTFKLFINLLAAAADGTETAAESYVVDFSQQ